MARSRPSWAVCQAAARELYLGSTWDVRQHEAAKKQEESKAQEIPTFLGLSHLGHSLVIRAFLLRPGVDRWKCHNRPPEERTG